MMVLARALESVEDEYDRPLTVLWHGLQLFIADAGGAKIITAKYIVVAFNWCQSASEEYTANHTGDAS